MYNITVCGLWKPWGKNTHNGTYSSLPRILLHRATPTCHISVFDNAHTRTVFKYYYFFSSYSSNSRVKTVLTGTKLVLQWFYPLVYRTAASLNAAAAPSFRDRPAGFHDRRVESRLGRRQRRRHRIKVKRSRRRSNNDNNHVLS